MNTASTLMGELARLEPGTRIYVSGQMTDNDAWRTEFGSARQYLEELGHAGVLPTENGLPEDAPWGDHLKADLAVIDTCGAVLMLTNWKLSRGARIEHDYAIGTGKLVLYQSRHDGDLFLADKIIAATCESSGITVEQLQSWTRTQVLANARLVVMELVSRSTELSCTQIGVLINRDHSTVASRRGGFSDLYKYNKPFRELVDSVLSRLPGLNKPKNY